MSPPHLAMQVNRDSKGSLLRNRVRKLLKSFSFEQLFIDELGWDECDQSLPLRLTDGLYELNAIAQKRGLIAYVCSADNGKIPASSIRGKIDTEITKFSREHLIIFVDRADTEQKWQWVRREVGSTTRRRELSFHRGQDGEAIVQRLEAISFSLEEEDDLTSAEVQRRTRKAFDIDQVTKKFYTRFAKEHQAFLSFITGMRSQLDHEWYASLMLNRLMFVYFIQKKGFLNGDTDYLRHRLEECQAQYQGKDQFYSFYRYFLLKLFHDGLGSPKRDSELETLLGRVPYLNGGLFEVHELEKEYPKLQIPDEAFERIFSFFDEYQWHLDARPLSNDREINPDVLGYIFEKYINQKQMGAYYTKEDITEYISKNTIIPFLFNAAEKAYPSAFRSEGAIWNLLKENPDRYIYEAVRKGVIDNSGAIIALPDEIATGIDDVAQRSGWNRPADEKFALPTETWREFVARRDRALEIRHKLSNGEISSIDDFITYNLDVRQFAQDVIETCDDPDLLRAFYGAISNVTCLDPTCGSGAFLFAAANILEPLYDACLERMQALLDDLERSEQKHRPEKFKDFRQTLNYARIHPNRKYFILKSIILNNLFGVDIMREATEICKLRLFLRLVSEVEPNATLPNYGLDPLPDIDFNIRAGNTLVGFANYEEVKQAIEGGEQKKLDLHGDMKRIDERAEIVDRAFQMFRRMQTEQSMKPGQFASGKAELRERLKELNQELNRYLASQYGVDAEKPKAFQEWVDSHQPFHWFIEFYSTMKRGGFDVIIGNPPYVEYRLVKDTYQIQPGYYQSESAKNLYAFSMERSCNLLQTLSYFGMIVPTGVIGLDDTVELRSTLLNNFAKSFCSTYSIRPSKLFEGVDQRLCIYLGKLGKQLNNKIFATKYHHWSAGERQNLLTRLVYNASFNHQRLHRVAQTGNSEAASVLKKLELHHQRTIKNHFYTRKDGYLMHYHRSPRYWIRAMNFEPHFKSASKERSVHHFRDLYFKQPDEGKVIGALLNSSLFFFWFISIGNGRNITTADVSDFPVGSFSESVLRDVPELFDQLMQDYRKNSFVRIRQDCEFQEFRPSASKNIIDEIDLVLAKHYGFTEEELDFIINYDIKYRMGRDAEGTEP